MFPSSETLGCSVVAAERPGLWRDGRSLEWWGGFDADRFAVKGLSEWPRARDLVQGLDVPCECRAPGGARRQPRARPSADLPFAHGDVAGVLECRRVLR